MATAVDRRAVAAWSVSACLCATCGSGGALAADAPLASRSLVSADSTDPAPRARHVFDWSAAVSVKETATDNVALAPDDSRRSDWVTEFLPSVQLRADGSRIRGSLAYQLDYLVYARSKGTDTRNFLNGSGVLEAVEQLLFVDGNVNISQQVVNPFGPRA